MHLDPDIVPIKLEPIGGFLRSLSGLRSAELPPGATMLDAPDAKELELAVQDLRHWIQDRPEQELPILTALVWLLNLPGPRLEQVAWDLAVPFQHGEISELHRFLEMLWSGVFGDWPIAEFDPEAYSFVGKQRYRPLDHGRPPRR